LRTEEEIYRKSVENPNKVKCHHKFKQGWPYCLGCGRSFTDIAVEDE